MAIHIRTKSLVGEDSVLRFCLQEATLSAIVITIYMMVNDAIEEYIKNHRGSRWRKYMATMTTMFFSSFVSIMAVLLIFGHRCGDSTAARSCRPRNRGRWKGRL